jgi:MFS transporter, DHA1 family, inner membrane transport protein
MTRVDEEAWVVKEELTRSQWVALIALAALQFLNLLDFMIVMPLGPRFKEPAHMGITTQQFGHMVASYGFAACVGGLIAAGWIDRWERKRALLWMVGGFGLSTLACYLAPNYISLVVARGLTGVFGGVLGSMSLTIVSDLFSDARRGFAIGIVTLGFSMATVVGIPLGLVIADAIGTPQSPFLLLALATVPIALLLAVTLPTLGDHLQTAPRPFIQTVMAGFAPAAHRTAFAFTVPLVFGTFMVAPYIATYTVNNLHFQNHQVKYIYIAGGVSTFLVMPIVGRLADRWGKLPLYRWLAAIAIIPTLIITHLTSAPIAAALVVTTFYMVCTSARMVPAQALIASASQPATRAGFMSLNSAVQHLAAGFASSISAAIVGESEAKAIEHFPWVGWSAGAALLVSVWFASRVGKG